MAPLVGRDITERYFLPRFEALCSDPLFHVRKVIGSILNNCLDMGKETRTGTCILSSVLIVYNIDYNFFVLVCCRCVHQTLVRCAVYLDLKWQVTKW